MLGKLPAEKSPTICVRPQECADRRPGSSLDIPGSSYLSEKHAGPSGFGGAALKHQFDDSTVA